MVAIPEMIKNKLTITVRTKLKIDQKIACRAWVDLRALLVPTHSIKGNGLSN